MPITAYDKYGLYYDKLRHNQFSSRMVEYTLEILERNQYRAKTCLDLCCGTGTALLELARAGLTVEGLDQSASMLAVARKKLRSYKIPVHRRTLPKIDIKGKVGQRMLRKRFDLVTSYFDSLNYITSERQLAATFKEVHRYLNPGGWFVFDLNTHVMLEGLWMNGMPWSGLEDEVAYIFQSKYHPETTSADLHLTLFVKEGRHWKRIDEIHRERAYPLGRIKEMLRAAGLTVKGAYNCMTFDRAESRARKICLVARRPD